MKGRMIEPRYTLVLRDLTVNNLLNLLWACEGASGLKRPLVQVEKVALGKLKKAVDDILQEHHANEDADFDPAFNPRRAA